MKKLFNTVFAFVLLIAMYVNIGFAKGYAQPDYSANISYQDFYDTLSPYGIWIEYPGYDHVWSPSVDGDFRPYLTNGNWEYSEEGWAWTSNYDWGWAPFHYGRWLYTFNYGWLWIPGYEWSPAWVVWGEVDDYYAWAPLYPGVNVGYYYDDYKPKAIYWNIVPREHIYDRDLYKEEEGRAKDNIYVNRIQTLNNFDKTTRHNQYYAKGPEIKDVEKYTGQKISPVAITSVDKVMPTKKDGNTLLVYRPVIIHPQPASYKRMLKDEIPKTDLSLISTPSIENLKQEHDVNVRKSESMNKVPQPQIEKRLESKMPFVTREDRTTQRQNIDRMPEIRSFVNSLERRTPTNNGIRKKN